MLTGEVLRAARAMARLEQAQLAQAAGLSVETIKRLERIRGAINANIRTISALTEALRRSDIHVEQHADGSLCLLCVRGGGVERERRIEALPKFEPSDLHRLIYYSSSAFAPEEAEAALSAILSKAAPVNTERGVSGALAFANGRFLQALEGERLQVLDLYGAIARDPRHRELTVVENRPVAVRRFPNWVMCARAASAAEIARADPSQADGFRPDLLSPAAALGVLTWVSELEFNALA